MWGVLRPAQMDTLHTRTGKRCIGQARSPTQAVLSPVRLVCSNRRRPLLWKVQCPPTPSSLEPTPSSMPVPWSSFPDHLNPTTLESSSNTHPSNNQSSLPNLLASWETFVAKNIVLIRNLCFSDKHEKLQSRNVPRNALTRSFIAQFASDAAHAIVSSKLLEQPNNCGAGTVILLYATD
jgi:hypothetical protein